MREEQVGGLRWRRWDPQDNIKAIVVVFCIKLIQQAHGKIKKNIIGVKVAKEFKNIKADWAFLAWLKWFLLGILINLEILIYFLYSINVKFHVT